MVWQAEMRVSADGLTLGAFVDAAALHIFARSDCRSKMDAARHFLDFMEALGVEFAHPDYVWDASAARDYAAEMLSEWEQTAEGN